MTTTPSILRGNFPAFQSQTIYPDPVVAFWITYATMFLDAGRWGAALDFGLQLFVCHNLSLEFNANSAAKKGQNPGFVVGPVTAGSVDKVSYSRDPSAAFAPDAGHWNLTIYGLRYWKLAQMMGAGPVQVGVPSLTDVSMSQGAWPGPFPTGIY